MTSVYDIFDISSLTALHVAASIGFRQLVVSLISNGYQDEVRARDSLGNSPVSTQGSSYFNERHLV